MNGYAPDRSAPVPLLTGPRLIFGAIGLIALLLLGLHPMWLAAIGDQLVVSDPLEQADAIVVLAGSSPARAQHALQLYRAGYAPRVIVSDERIDTHGLATTWGELYRLGVAPLPIQESALTILPVATSTYDEAVWSRDVLQRLALQSAIIVTDPFHSRRARTVFAHVFGEAGLVVRVSPTNNPAKSVDRWWEDEEKAYAVVMEYAKFAYYAVRGRLL